MKLLTVMFLIGAALPAAALAESTAAAPAEQGQPAAPAADQGPATIKQGARLQTPEQRQRQVAATRKWSLEKVTEKQQSEEHQVQMAGPAMPAEPVVKVPRQRTAAARPREAKKPKPNAAKVFAPVLRKDRR